jgi:hypothetical protein
MSKAVWPQAFPGGVADEAARFALWRDPQGRLVALRLADGQVLWRSPPGLQPVILGHGWAVGAAVSPPHLIAFTLEGPSAGAPAWRSAPLPWPEWAAVADPARVERLLDAAWLGTRLGLHWSLHQRYTGGAPPDAAHAKNAACSGACVIDPATGDVQPLAAWPARPAPHALPEPSDDPRVLGQCRLGDRRYRVVAQEASGLRRTVLEALDATSGQRLWECLLDESPRRPPRALRP